MVSYAKFPRIPQIAFQVQGELQKSLPIRLEDFSEGKIDEYIDALSLDCGTFQGCGFPYADDILPGYQIRYDDMAKSYLNGVVLPKTSPYVHGHPELYMQNSIFSFVIILEKGDIDKDVRQLMSGFRDQGMNYTPVPEPPYCLLMPGDGYTAHIEHMHDLYTVIRGYAMAWYLMGYVYT